MLNVSVKKPEIADWLRHVSDEAAKRIDEAHVRMSTDQSEPWRRRVVSRELLSVQPADESYKDVA